VIYIATLLNAVLESHKDNPKHIMRGTK